MCCFLAYDQYTSIFLKILFVSKNIHYLEFEEKNCFNMDFAKKNHFLHFEILQHVCKNPKGIGQYFNNIKILFLGIYYSLSVFR